MLSFLANIYKSLRVLINENSVDGQHSQQLSTKWKIISNVSWQQEVPQCSKQQSWGNSKDVVAHHINQKLFFFVYHCCLTFLWSGLRITQLQLIHLFLTGPVISLWASALRKCVTAVCLIGHSKCFIYSLHAMLRNWFWHVSLLIRF